MEPMEPVVLCSLTLCSSSSTVHCTELKKETKKPDAGSPAVCDKWVEKNTMQLVYSVLTGCKQNNMSIKTKPPEKSKMAAAVSPRPDSGL